MLIFAYHLQCNNLLVYMRLSPHFHAGMSFHAGMKKWHKIFMPPGNECFMPPRHHVNTIAAQISTRYETHAGMKAHVGMDFILGLM